MKNKVVFCDGYGNEYGPLSLGTRVRMLPETWRDWYKGREVSPKALLLLLYTWLRLFFSPRRNTMMLFMYNDPTGEMTMHQLRHMEMAYMRFSVKNANLKALLNSSYCKEHIDALKEEGKIQEGYTLDMINHLIDERLFGRR